MHRGSPQHTTRVLTAVPTVYREVLAGTHSRSPSLDAAGIRGTLRYFSLTFLRALAREPNVSVSLPLSSCEDLYPLNHLINYYSSIPLIYTWHRLGVGMPVRIREYPPAVMM